MRMILMAAACAAALGGCSTTRAAVSGPPSYAPAATQAAPEQARFYADCIAQAASAHTYDRQGNTLRFQCQGDVAGAFWAGLESWTAQIGSEHTDANGRIWRPTARVQSDLVGLDYCWKDVDGGFGCAVVLNVGGYLSH